MSPKKRMWVMVPTIIYVAVLFISGLSPVSHVDEIGDSVDVVAADTPEIERRPSTRGYLTSSAYMDSFYNELNVIESTQEGAIFVEERVEGAFDGVSGLIMDTVDDSSSIQIDSYGFVFPDTVNEDARSYLVAMYEQALDACKDTEYPDPFMSMALSVIENPVRNHEVFRLPLVYQDTLDAAMSANDGSFAAAIDRSDESRSYSRTGCVGPLQIAVAYVAAEKRDPTVWSSSATMFYEDATLAIEGMSLFAEQCGLEVTDTFMYTLSAMRHNVGNLSDWAGTSPNKSPSRDFIPFTTKSAVYEWCYALSSEEGQTYFKEKAVESYLNYLGDVYFTNGLEGWREVAAVTGYDTSKILSNPGHRPLYPASFWHNYYLLRLLYGVDTPEKLGVVT